MIVLPDVIEEARDYAFKSKDYTEDYEGWKDGHKKIDRITDGRIAQIMLGRIATSYGVPIETDGTDYKTVDKFDVKIVSDIVESKTTRVHYLIGQVAMQHNPRQPDYYCFSRIDQDERCLYITFIGLVSFHDYWARKTFVPGGERIPGSSIINRFKNGTCILNRNTGYKYEVSSVSLDHYLQKWQVLLSLKAGYNEQATDQNRTAK